MEALVSLELQRLAIQFSSVVQSYPTLCDPMNCSTPGLPVHRQLLEFTQTHVYWVSDAIQPSHPLSSPSPPAPNPSQHQRVFSNESTLRMRWPKYWSFSFSIRLLRVSILGTQMPCEVIFQIMNNSWQILKNWTKHNVYSIHTATPFLINFSIY